MPTRIIALVLSLAAVGLAACGCSRADGAQVGPLYADKNLSDLDSAATARTNLGVAAASSGTYTAPTVATSLTASYATATTVPYFDASKNLVSSAVTPTELGLLSSADRVVKVEKQALAAVRTAGGVLGWTNPTGGSIIVTGLVLNVTTASTGASTINCGIGTDATTASDVLIDGVSGTPAAVLDDQKDAGTNGVGAGLVASTEAVTCSEASGDVTGIAGFAYIYYHAI